MKPTSRENIDNQVVSSVYKAIFRRDIISIGAFERKSQNFWNKVFLDLESEVFEPVAGQVKQQIQTRLRTKFKNAEVQP